MKFSQKRADAVTVTKGRTYPSRAPRKLPSAEDRESILSTNSEQNSHKHIIFSPMPPDWEQLHLLVKFQ